MPNTLSMKRQTSSGETVTAEVVIRHEFTAHGDRNSRYQNGWVRIGDGAAKSVQPSLRVLTDRPHELADDVLAEQWLDGVLSDWKVAV
jgi:hypothetical protein